MFILVTKNIPTLHFLNVDMLYLQIGKYPLYMDYIVNGLVSLSYTLKILELRFESSDLG